VDPSQSETGELTSWKEIANYLSVSVRTAQKWEGERNLPVRRLPGAGRSRILVTVSELEAWKQSGSSGAPILKSLWPRRKVLALSGISALLAICAALIWLRATPRPVPVSGRVDGNSLIVTDAKGREMWRKILTEKATELATRPDCRQLWLGDLDDDGLTEVLYAFRPASGVGASALFCFSQSGVEKWRFYPGRNVATRVEAFQPPFVIRAFEVIRPAPNQSARIVVTSHHNLYYPNQVAVLNPAGQMLREYWHSGWLEVLTASDLDGDGSPEIFLGGIANSYRQAVLLVLDPRQLDGASHEDNGDYQLLNFRQPVEKARVLFPRSCISRLSQPENVVRQILVSGSDIRVIVSEELRPAESALVSWHIDNLFQRSRFVLWDTLKSRHHELEVAGAIRHHLVDDLSELGELRWLTRF
jgi:hypothetical protein